MREMQESVFGKTREQRQYLVECSGATFSGSGREGAEGGQVGDNPRGPGDRQLWDFSAQLKWQEAHHTESLVCRADPSPGFGVNCSRCWR